MSTKGIITVGMIRLANEKIMSAGAARQPHQTPYSFSLGKEVPNPVRSDSETINSAWKKVCERDSHDI